MSTKRYVNTPVSFKCVFSTIFLNLFESIDIGGSKYIKFTNHVIINISIVTAKGEQLKFSSFLQYLDVDIANVGKQSGELANIGPTKRVTIWGTKHCCISDQGTTNERCVWNWSFGWLTCEWAHRILGRGQC